MLEKLIESYAYIVYGHTIEDENILKELRKTINYLIDNNYDKAFILSYLLEYGPVISETLWHDTLLKPNTFYYHEQLTIMPGPSIWNPNMKEQSHRFYLEMKIKYTIDDLLNYYYTELLIPVELRDRSKDKGAFEYMLKKYTKFKCEPIDFILYLIDYSKQEEAFITNVFDLQKYERETYEKINHIVENNIYKNIIWRG